MGKGLFDEVAFKYTGIGDPGCWGTFIAPQDATPPLLELTHQAATIIIMLMIPYVVPAS